MYWKSFKWYFNFNIFFVGSWKPDQMPGYRSKRGTLCDRIRRRWYKGMANMKKKIEVLTPKSTNPWSVILGLGFNGSHAAVQLHRWACAQQLLQAHWPRCDAVADRSGWSPLLLWCWWFHESSATAGPGIDCPFAVLVY